jgi:hypothetical protein
MTQIWLAVDVDGEEFIYNIEPHRLSHCWAGDMDEPYIKLPEGSIEKLIGRKLTWEDDAVIVEGERR